MRKRIRQTLKRVSPLTNAYYVRAAINGRRQNIGIVRYRSTDKWDAETIDGYPLGTATTDRRAVAMVEERSADGTQHDQSVERLRCLVARAQGPRAARVA